jgi:hypothetical protein
LQAAAAVLAGWKITVLTRATYSASVDREVQRVSVDQRHRSGVRRVETPPVDMSKSVASNPPPDIASHMR